MIWLQIVANMNGPVRLAGSTGFKPKIPVYFLDFVKSWGKDGATGFLYALMICWK